VKVLPHLPLARSEAMSRTRWEASGPATQVRDILFHLSHLESIGLECYDTRDVSNYGFILSQHKYDILYTTECFHDLCLQTRAASHSAMVSRVHSMQHLHLAHQLQVKPS
jgi:hypothetical protein